MVYQNIVNRSRTCFEDLRLTFETSKLEYLKRNPMFDPETAMAAARVMSAAAWINGSVDPEQERAIRSFFSKVKGLDEAFWRHLGTLLSRPMDEAERITHLRDLRDVVKDDGLLRIVQQAVNEVIIANGEITESERSAMKHFSRMVRSPESEVSEEMIRILRGLPSKTTAVPQKRSA